MNIGYRPVRHYFLLTLCFYEFFYLFFLRNYSSGTILSAKKFCPVKAQTLLYPTRRAAATDG